MKHEIPPLPPPQRDGPAGPRSRFDWLIGPAAIVGAFIMWAFVVWALIFVFRV